MMRRWMYMFTAFSVMGVLVFTLFWLTGGVWAGANTPQGAAATPVPVGTAFTYQGELLQGGSPANGKFDFRFRLFDAATGGSQVGPTVTKNDVQVTNGRFTVMLDFGANAFTGNARWLEIEVRPGGSSGSYTRLSPRQSISPVPYALYALNSGGGSGNAHDHLGQTWTGAVTTGLRINNRQNTGVSYGFIGQVDSPAGYGVAGVANSKPGSAVGVLGLSRSADGIGVWGVTTSTIGSGTGVVGQSSGPLGAGVAGYGAVTGTIGIAQTVGVYGEAHDPNGAGVKGVITYTNKSYAGGAGVYGESRVSEGVGVLGVSNPCPLPVWFCMIYGNFAPGTGVRGEGSLHGVLGENHYAPMHEETYGVKGVSSAPMGIGVYGLGDATGYFRRSPHGGSAIGVKGVTLDESGVGVYAVSEYTGTESYALVAETYSAIGYAGWFSGNVKIVGTLTKSAGGFKIDHPLDPENKYLYHSFVESPDMKNFYDGVVVLDENGEAWVELPEWFEALNKDFRYQLTPIGASMPGLYIAEEIKNNRFKIAGGVPGKKVSWQVTGIRNDPYARDHRIPVEEEKSESERGRYLYPEGYNQPPEKRVENVLFRRHSPVSKSVEK